MNEIDISEDHLSQVDFFRDINIVCPKCKTKKTLKIPLKIINQSKHLTTVSIPAGIVCEHSFQTFIDKNLIVRGYQPVDFEISTMEYYEGSYKTIEGEQKDENGISTLSSLPSFQDIIHLLRGSVDDKVLGSAIFTTEGKVLYSSLPLNNLINTIKEFEVRNEKNLISFSRMFIELNNNQKLCSEYIKIHDINFILILMFSSEVKFGMGYLFLRDLAKKIRQLT